MKLRPITPMDNQRVAHIIRTVMTEYGAVGEGYSIEDPEVDRMYETYASPKSYFLVLENSAKEVVGCGGIAPLKGGADSVCELQKMYFLKEGRGYGFGKQLIKDCLAKASELGYEKCYLETVERMKEANQLYTKMGFQQLASNEGDTGHCSCDSYYIKDL